MQGIEMLSLGSFKIGAILLVTASLISFVVLVYVKLGLICMYEYLIMFSKLCHF